MAFCQESLHDISLRGVCGQRACRVAAECCRNEAGQAARKFERIRDRKPFHFQRTKPRSSFNFLFILSPDVAWRKRLPSKQLKLSIVQEIQNIWPMIDLQTCCTVFQLATKPDFHSLSPFVPPLRDDPLQCRQSASLPQTVASSLQRCLFMCRISVEMVTVALAQDGAMLRYASCCTKLRPGTSRRI